MSVSDENMPPDYRFAKAIWDRKEGLQARDHFEKEFPPIVAAEESESCLYDQNHPLFFAGKLVVRRI